MAATNLHKGIKRHSQWNLFSQFAVKVQEPCQNRIDPE
ncbi:MAG: hypothetical protein ALAOOOJD_02193 [bacterium]|nr:hypothetical protein [bacterium]